MAIFVQDHVMVFRVILIGQVFEHQHLSNRGQLFEYARPIEFFQADVEQAEAVVDYQVGFVMGYDRATTDAFDLVSHYYLSQFFIIHT